MYRCHFCPAQLASKFDFDRARAWDWDWFTGYGEKTVHVCPNCLVSKTSEVNALRDRLNTKPDGYPRTKVKLAKVVCGPLS